MKVYKYYSPKDYNFDALKQGYFYFSKVAKLNDPFDASFDLVNESKAFLKIVKPTLRSDAKAVMSNYGTCSFSLDIDNKVLWALYAENYKGFVIEYDDTTFESLQMDLQARLPYQKVVYKEECPNLDDLNYSFEYLNSEGVSETIRLKNCLEDQKNMDKLFVHLCAYKNVVWEKENEMRLIAAMDIIRSKEKQLIINENNGYKIPMPKKAIQRIIIGHHFQNEHISEIKEASQKWNVPVYQIKIGLPFNLDIEPMPF